MPSKHESSARVDYVPALCTHRPSLLPIERFSEVFGLGPRGVFLLGFRKVSQTVAFRGSKSRNKVSVGEPAEGSLQFELYFRLEFEECFGSWRVLVMRQASVAAACLRRSFHTEGSLSSSSWWPAGGRSVYLLLKELSPARAGYSLRTPCGVS